MTRSVFGPPPVRPKHPQREFPDRPRVWPRDPGPQCLLVIGWEADEVSLSAMYPGAPVYRLPVPPDDPRRACFRIELAKAGVFKGVVP